MSTYDGAGRQTASYTGYYSGTGTDDVTSLTDNIVFKQTVTTHDAAGNVTFTSSYQRWDTATGTGALNPRTGSQPKARVTYVASWYDGIGRSVASANYGTNADSGAPTRPDSRPSSSDTVLVSQTNYNGRGEAFEAVDPAGTVNRRTSDDAGRVTKAVQNYTDGNPATGDADEDVTVKTIYTADGQVSTLTAMNSDTGDQVTTYVYGTATGGITPLIYRNDLLRAVIYPDSDNPADLSGNGAGGVYDRVEYKYNRQGDRIEMKDQNETVHEYTYDGLGRPLADMATVAGGSAVDQSVLRIDRAYEVRGLLETVTSYDGTNLQTANVVNQCKRSYNGFGELTSEQQQHSGAVSGGSPKVKYGYTDGSSGHSRLTKITYPNGRLLHFGYDSRADDKLSRVSSLADDNGSGSAGTHLAEYTYLGLQGTVKVDYTEPDLRYDLDHGTAGTYDGLDRFGRVVDLLWYDYDSSSDAARIKRGYDRVGSPTYRENPVAASQSPAVHLDELYTHDGISRLQDLERGDLNTNKDGLIAGTKNFAETWGLDATGNWDSFKEDTDGSGWSLEQTRDHNKVNEITVIDETTGPSWVTPSHDRAGNMTEIPQPSAPTSSFDLTWDPWNRLVKVEDGTNAVAEYEYDGTNRRTLKKVYSGGELDETRHFYYTNEWQVLEERVDTATTAAAQYVWGLRYVDDLVLRDRNADGNTSAGDYGKTGSGLEERLYALQDPNWNVVAIADANGDVQERYVYSAYGTVTIYNPDWSATRSQSNYDQAYLYTGRELDTETGRYFYRARYYDAELGRFVSRDPIEYKGSAYNLYAYVDNKPITSIDPSGTKLGSCTVCACALGAAFVTAEACAVVCIQDGFWDVPGEGFASCFNKCMFSTPAAIIWGSASGIAVFSCIICFTPVPTP